MTQLYNLVEVNDLCYEPGTAISPRRLSRLHHCLSWVRSVEWQFWACVVEQGRNKCASRFSFPDYQLIFQLWVSESANDASTRLGKD